MAMSRFQFLLAAVFLGLFQMLLNAAKEQDRRLSFNEETYQVRIDGEVVQPMLKDDEFAFQLMGFGDMTCHDLQVLLHTLEDLSLEDTRLINLQQLNCLEFPKIKRTRPRVVPIPEDIPLNKHRSKTM